MVVVPASSFIMGSPKNEKRDFEGVRPGECSWWRLHERKSQPLDYLFSAWRAG
jgi:hypothetical protein